MAKHTASMARNAIRRSLEAILDPYPSPASDTQLWLHFESSCAYCGSPVSQELRTGHRDHIIPASAGGSNGVYNQVLACGHCNGDEKREEAWEDFLLRKVQDLALFHHRRNRILAWLAMAPAVSALEPGIRQRADEIISRALADYSQAVEDLRALRTPGA